MSDEQGLAALRKLMQALDSAQSTYDAAMTPEERELQKTCDCELCQGMRLMRNAIEQWKAGGMWPPTTKQQD